MKKETKEVVNWMQWKLSDDFRILKGSEEKDFQLKALKLLGSLPEIELHLCRGGYIQDKNGTPCCEGDEVIYTEESLPVAVRGVLTWNKNSGCFRIRHSMGTILGPINTSNLEKVPND